ncbi:hypothetical protein MMC24_003946 [Lignoscripta atroalba]|nr:hypothetical protein [Lignoscripta atroalba]
MVSNADDSSIDDNLSSIGDSTWDIIDDASAATSDDEDRNLMRQDTASSDGNEEDPEDRESLKGVDTSDESQGNESAHGQPQYGKDKEEGCSVSQDSCSTQTTGPGSGEDEKAMVVGTVPDCLSSEYHGQPSIIFDEPRTGSAESFGWVDVSHTLKVFEKGQIAQISQHIRLGSSPTQVVATIRQTMRSKGLQPKEKEPYKILYVGDLIARQPIIQKIGEALASSFRTTANLAKSGPARYNVVPISAFGAGSSPEVMLIDTPWPALSVEECTFASFSKEKGGKTNISLTLNHQEKIHSVWHGTSYSVSDGSKLPDIAVMYAPDKEDVNAKSTRTYAKSFMTRHGVPVIAVSGSPSWLKPYEVNTLDHKTPHLCLESRDPSSVAPPVLNRLPIDLPTFLDIDVHQMSRNLACLASTRAAAQSEQKTSNCPASQSQQKVYEPSLGFVKVPDRPSSFINDVLVYIRAHVAPEVRSAFVIGSVLLFSFLLVVGTVSSMGLRRFTNTQKALGVASGIHEPMQNTNPTAFLSPVQDFSKRRNQLVEGLKKRHDAEKLQKQAAIAVNAQPSADNSISIVHSSSDLTSFLLNSNTFAPDRSDKFKVQIVGDCHVVLRPPHWFTQLRRPPPLLFRVSRHEKTLDHQFSTLFDGVYALRIPREDAHGSLNISLSTRSKPKINETFQVDFGTVWLKVAGWKKAAQAVTDQIRQELDSAQTGLVIFYGHTSTGIQSFLRDAFKHADSVLMEAEHAGVTVLNQTMKTTEIMVAQTRELSHTLSKKMHRKKSNLSSQLQAHRQHLREDVIVYARELSTMLSRQTQVLAQAATGVNVKALKTEITDLHIRYLRETQKKVLRIWWTVRGLPVSKRLRSASRLRSKAPRTKSKKGSNR